MKKLLGTGIAMITPFKGDKSIDFEALTKLTQHLIDGGVDYLVVMGTTAESPTLNKIEKIKVLDHVLQINNGRLPVVYGMGGNSTQTLLEELGNADLEGVDAILSASPYYNKPNQRGIIEHYKQIADVSSRPIILYNVPARTSSNMEATTTLELSEHPNIIGVKEASGKIEQVMHIINEKPDDFLMISGEDALTYPMLTLGGEGVISVVGNAYPAILSKMVRAALKGDYETARANHYTLLKVTDCLFEDGNPAGIKACLAMMGICEEELRLPLVQVNKATRRALEYQMEELA